MSEELMIFFERNKKTIKTIGIFVFSLILFISIVLLCFYLFWPDQEENTKKPDSKQLGNTLVDNENVGINSDKLSGIRAEEIMFGHFYKKSDDAFRSKLTTYTLPIDVKSGVENYYDVSRKIDLSAHVEDLNRDGFKIINNPFPGHNNFYSLYNSLLVNEVPIVLTSDFLMYNYQNNLKNVFGEIQRNTFYKNVWDIYNNLFKVASSRYEERLARLGLSSDPILEGQRLETAYLAVVLKLLTPSVEQVSERETLNNYSKFSKNEAIYYDFILPDYLTKDVGQELQYIRKLNQVQKSPVFLYPKDYSLFKVPKEYQGDAKLNNFYLATKWLNSEFPLYYKSESCLDCLLDKNDWLINMTSAAYLAKDLSDNQISKNKWAIIYKFVSYFTGLRQDLTFLEYNRALENIYGKDYEIDKIFNKKSITDLDIFRIQDKIAENKFSEIEGSYSRKNGKNPLVGMRMLQEPYWPNEYIFKRLTGEKMTSTIASIRESNQGTLCRGYRCMGTALDIINIKNPLDGNAKFDKESSYNTYDFEVQGLRDYLRGFNVFTWNTNVYWSTLDTINATLLEDRSLYPAFMKSDKWFNEKALNTALGTWANIHMPNDTIGVATELSSDPSGLRPICDLPNFIEPNLGYLNENISRNNMLLEMMDVLNVSRDSNLAALDIEEINTMFKRVIEINKKILSNQVTSYNDCMYIRNLVNKQVLSGADSKTFNIKLDASTIQEKIDGVKLLIVVFGSGDDKIIAMGPVFNYSEVLARVK